MARASVRKRKFERSQLSPSRRKAIVGLFKLEMKVIPNITVGTITSFGSSS